MEAGARNSRFMSVCVIFSCMVFLNSWPKCWADFHCWWLKGRVLLREKCCERSRWNVRQIVCMHCMAHMSWNEVTPMLSWVWYPNYSDNGYTVSQRIQNLGWKYRGECKITLATSRFDDSHEIHIEVKDSTRRSIFSSHCSKRSCKMPVDRTNNNWFSFYIGK